MRIPACLFLLVLAGAARAGEPVDWLPDMIVDKAYLLDHTVTVGTVEPGRTHLLLSNATPNIGLGDLYVHGLLPPNPDGSQDVMQRIFRSDGTYFDRPAGRFVFHPEHDHIHLEDWAQYRLREVRWDGSPGEVVAQGGKTSFCLRDSRVYDASLPNFRFPGRYNECAGIVQGVSVGYEDVYSKNLPDQWIDITGLPDGEYWLESEVDPENRILEADETNNVERLRITIGRPRSPIYFILVNILIALRQFLSWFRRG